MWTREGLVLTIHLSAVGGHHHGAVALSRGRAGIQAGSGDVLAAAALRGAQHDRGRRATSAATCRSVVKASHLAACSGERFTQTRSTIRTTPRGNPQMRE